METPLISIIVPVYNVHEYLGDCFNSLIAQTYPKLEFVVVDDGSTDGSGVVCDEFAKKDSRVKVIHQNNAGLSAARNRGIAESTGAYIAFLDSDDFLAPDYAQYLYSLCAKYQSKMSICAIKEITEKKKEIDYGAIYDEKIMSTEEALGRMLREEGFNVSAYAKLYRRDLFEGVTFPEGAVHEDLGTTYKLIQKCPRVAYGPEAKYNYRKRSGSISAAEFSDKKFDIIKLTDAMCEELSNSFPYLINTTNLRKAHGRFSVLRQMLNVKELTPAQKEQETEIIKWLKENKTFVTKNPVASGRDKIAMYSLLVGKWMFKLSWNIYLILRGQFHADKPSK